MPWQSGASRCLWEAALVFEGDLLVGQSLLEENHLFKALSFTLQHESPSCPFSHIHGGIR